MHNMIKKWLAFIVIGLFFSVFSACGTTRDSSKLSSKADSAKEAQLREVIITLAREMVGTKYKSNGKKPGGFDCSGLVYYVFGRMEIPMAANAAGQAELGSKIDLDEAKPGDLLFFSTGKNISHVGIITENSKKILKLVHSSSSRGVIEENILNSDYWVRRMRKVTSLKSYPKKPS